MARLDPTGAAGRLARAAAKAGWKDRAKQAAATLKAEYEAGKRGDDAPARQIWGTPKEQLDAMLRLLRAAPETSSTTDSSGTAPDGSDGADASNATTGPTGADGAHDVEAAEVAAAMRGVDWASVRAATAERTSEVASAMRSMAEHVDWSRVQPVAAHVSSALIAAVASGRIGVGGPLGSTVAQAILGQTNLAERVATQMQRERAPMPPDFRGAIEATSREV